MALRLFCYMVRRHHAATLYIKRLSATVGMSVTVGEASATVGEMSVTVGGCLQQRGK